MSDRLLIGTRKGLFIATRKGRNWDLGPLHFAGQSVTLAVRDPRHDTIYAALADGHFGVKLHRSPDGGTQWEELTPPAFPTEEGVEDGPSVEAVWSIAPAGEDEPDTLWAGTIGGGLFRSDDRGESWSLNEALWSVPSRDEWFGGGYDEPGIHSICIHPQRKGHLVAAISSGGVWRSTDNGASWSSVAKGMRADYVPPELMYSESSQDPHLVVQVRDHPDVFWSQHHCGIFRSGDDLGHWDELHPKAPSAFGFAVAAHPSDPNTAWFVPAVKDEYRYPVDGNFVVTRTSDGGKTFEVLSAGLPEDPAYDLVYRHALDVDGEGRRLAMGSTTGGAWVSDDAGESWTALPARLPPVHSVRMM